jgi:hypothetical protein
MSNRLLEVRTIIEEIERDNDTAELTELSQYLDGFRQKITVRAMSLPEQLNSIAAAALTNDRRTLQMFTFSQYEEAANWARESLSPRGPGWPRLTL